MTTVHRIDRIRLDASTVVVHANGWMDAWGVATTADAVYDYPEFGTRELRPRDEVFSPDSLASLRGVPITIDHPPDDVDSHNARELTHGWVMDVRPEPDSNPPQVFTRMRFATDQILDAIKAGTIELSCGYDARYDATPGSLPDGTPYTGVQHDIRYNHLALVDLARAGHVARLRLDSDARKRKDSAMHTLVIGKHTRKVAKFIADSIAQQAAAWKPPEGKRRDEIQVSEITIDGTTLVLPKEMVDALLASLGIGAPSSSEPPPTSDPMTASAPPPPQQDRRGDAAKSEQQVDVAALTKKHVDAALAAEHTRASIERKAMPILGDSHDYADPWATAAAAIARVDSKRGERAKTFAERASKGDFHAQGYLLANLDDAVAEYRDRKDSSGELGAFIDGARRGDSGEQTQRKDAIADSHAKMMRRLRGQPEPKTESKGAA